MTSSYRVRACSKRAPSRMCCKELDIWDDDARERCKKVVKQLSNLSSWLKSNSYSYTPTIVALTACTNQKDVLSDRPPSP